MTITIPQKKRRAPQADKLPPTPEEFVMAVEKKSDQIISEKEKPNLSVSPITTQRQRAIMILEGHLPWAAATGIMPIPVIDLAAIITVQLRMLSKIALVYNVPFREQAAKSAITALMAGGLQQTLAVSLVGGVRFIPIIGTLASITVFPALAMASTYALGRVFISHFETGGNFLNFDPSKSRLIYNRELEMAKRKASKYVSFNT